ncbi:MAG: hypothetical protein LBI10_10275, partial [Deltaproteobacteria bacterium]|nr:hypothetical protein [Deltaproteobacteria bacterium]
MASKLLVRGLNWLGDAVMSLPALASLGQEEPAKEIMVVAGPSATAVYSRAPLRPKVLADPKGLRSRLKLIKALKNFSPEKTLLLQNAFGAAALAFLAGLPNREGYARDGRGILLNRAIPIQPKYRLAHEAFYYLGLLTDLGYPAAYSSPRLVLEPDDLKLSQDLSLSKEGFYLALAPG